MLCLSRGEDRSYVPGSIDQTRSLSSGSRNAAPSKLTYSNRSVRGPWPTTSIYLVRLVRTHIYDFLLMVFGQNPMSYRSYLRLREKYWWPTGHVYGLRKHSIMTSGETLVPIVVHWWSAGHIYGFREHSYCSILNIPIVVLLIFLL